jgi:hypothetical protein
MAAKIVCFECKEHSTYNKVGQCYRCQSHFIGRSGSAFRLPKKTNQTAWKELKEIFLAQIKLQDSEKSYYFWGFGNNFYLHGCQRKTDFPMRLKEKATIEVLKKEYC